MSYTHVKAWRLRNPEYNKLWMRKYRNAKAVKKEKKEIKQIIPTAQKYRLPENLESEK